MSTTARECFFQPDILPKPNLKELTPVKTVDFRASINRRPMTQNRSGYCQNFTLADGPGHLPMKVCHGDMFRTEYRNRFNPSKPFHKMDVPLSTGKMKQKRLVYDTVH